MNLKFSNTSCFKYTITSLGKSSDNWFACGSKKN